MLIGIDASRTTTGRRTGTEAYAYSLIQALIPLAGAAGHRLRLYFNQLPPVGLLPDSQAIETRVIPFPRLWTHLRLAAELQRQSPDVFFTPAHVIPFSYFGPSVATIHDLGYLAFPEAHTARQLAYLRWSTAHNARRGRLIVADSGATKRDLIEHYQVDQAKIEVIYPGIDPSLARVDDEAELRRVTEKYGIQRPYLLTIGTLQPRKNLTRLIEAHAESGVDAQLVLSGKPGWRFEPILSTVEQYRRTLTGGRSSILLPGFVADEEKAALISGAEALLFPSLYEGFGFPVLEGNACGTPVLAANSSSLPEIAGDAALLVDPLESDDIAAGITRITTDQALRQRLRTAGLANIERFSWTEAAGQLLETLVRVAGQ